MGLVKPYVALIGTRTTNQNKMSTQTKAPQTMETYHRLRSYHPKPTTHDRLHNLPHICRSKYWKDSPHLGHRCNNCNEVEKIIRMEDYLEEKYHNRQYSLFHCTCHWCRNRRRLSHDGCNLCDEDTVKIEDGIIYLSEEDEEEINKLPTIDNSKKDDDDDTLPLDSKKGWETYAGYYYDEETNLHHPYCSWEEVPLKPGEVLINYWNFLSVPASGSEGTDGPEFGDSDSERPSGDPEDASGSSENASGGSEIPNDAPEEFSANQNDGYEITRPADQSRDQERYEKEESSLPLKNENEKILS